MSPSSSASIEAHLDHPALAAPLAAGIVGASAYLAQEFVAADSLDSIVREFGPAPPADALRVAAQIGGALDFASVVNIGHGAMHPRDILLSSDETRVTGIGVAGALEKVGVAAPVRRPYTAPERTGGGAWDRRADVFSLAAVIHELLWAKRPAGTGALAADALDEIEGGELDALRAVFARALADDPAERFGTALDFVQALNAAFPDVTVAPAAPREYTEEPASRRSALDQMLPLDADPDATIVAPRASVPPFAEADLDAEVDADVDTIAMFAAEEKRYQDVEAAPAKVEQVPAVVADVPQPKPVAAPPALVEKPQTVSVPEPPLEHAIEPAVAPRQELPLSLGAVPPPTLERPRSAFRPVILALIVGLAVGFAGGYGVGTRNVSDTPPPAASAAPETAPPSSPSASTTPSSAPRGAAPSATGKTTAAPPSTSTRGGARAGARAGAPPASARGREFTESTVPSAPKAAAAPSSAPASSARGADASASEAGRLLVRSTPAGANVAVDGKEYGQTPVAVRELARGAHRVRVTRDGYAAVERHVVITASQPSQSLTIPLERPTDPAAARAADAASTSARDSGSGFSGSLVVDSRPSGANVFLDGKLAGTTPVAIPGVRAGEHVVRIERDGYRRWSSSVRVVSAEQNRVTASLER